MADWQVHPDVRVGKNVGFMLVQAAPDPRGFGWRRQIRAWGEVDSGDGLTQDEAATIAAALNAVPAPTP